MTDKIKGFVLTFLTAVLAIYLIEKFEPLKKIIKG